MPRFGQSKDPAEAEFARARQQMEDDAAQAKQRAMFETARAMAEWACEAPAADLATELMAAFDPDGPQRGQTLDRGYLIRWLRPDPGYVSALRRPISEAVQLLEHANLVCIDDITDSGVRLWSITRLGAATLASGKAAVRQRIKDRTGL